MNNRWIHCNEEVSAALAANEPVLAMESSIIAQGMPWPQNYETALDLCELARGQGVTPAVIAVIDGAVRIGLDASQIERLATAPERFKATTRNLPAILSSGALGGTTVAATMHCAQTVGIATFATGGIGGVHRELERTLDISADLLEFTRSPVMVVSAGIKAILDIPRTLEMLETLGVPVVSWRTDHFPAFYSRESGQRSERIDSVDEIVRRFIIQRQILPGVGMLIGNPITREDEIPFAEIDALVGQALMELNTMRNEGKSSGAEVTPYLLEQMNRLTGGRSLQANICLVRQNVQLGCEIAIAWAALGNTHSQES